MRKITPLLEGSAEVMGQALRKGPGNGSFCGGYVTPLGEQAGCGGAGKLVSRLSCCVTSDRPVPPWASCPSDLGKGLRGRCGFCRPETPKVIIGVWPCLPRGPSPVSAHRIPLGPQGTRVKKRTQQNGGWSWGRIPATTQPLAPCDCSGPRFSPCAVGQQPSSAGHTSC